jgi:hypothetical protein
MTVVSGVDRVSPSGPVRETGHTALGSGWPSLGGLTNGPTRGGGATPTTC